MNLKFDDGELEGSSYLGAGTYECRVTKLERKPTKKGGEMVEIEFTAMNGRTTRDWFPTTGNKFKLAALAIACGFDKAFLMSGDFTTQLLANKHVKVTRELTGEETYTDKNGVEKTRKNYDNHYHRSENNAPAAGGDEPIF